MYQLARRRTLVTGGAGFLGSHLCERLLERGHDVICVDNFFTGTRDNVASMLGNPHFELVRHALVRVPGIRLLPAMQGQLGFDLAREHQPDLILLDLHLPDIPGDEVLRRLREDPATRRIPVIMISADAMPAQVDRLLKAGACAYLTKPLDIKKFLDHVKQILGDGAPSPAGHPH